MRDAFKGFLLLRFVAFLALLGVVAIVVGISLLTRGSTAGGIAVIALGVVATAAVVVFVARRARRPR
jgi:membrane protein implicated in regulation of membrane protease activity